MCAHPRGGLLTNSQKRQICSAASTAEFRARINPPADQSLGQRDVMRALGLQRFHVSTSAELYAWPKLRSHPKSQGWLRSAWPPQPSFWKGQLRRLPSSLVSEPFWWPLRCFSQADALNPLNRAAEASTNSSRRFMEMPSLRAAYAWQRCFAARMTTWCSSPVVPGPCEATAVPPRSSVADQA